MVVHITFVGGKIKSFYNVRYVRYGAYRLSIHLKIEDHRGKSVYSYDNNVLSYVEVQDIES